MRSQGRKGEIWLRTSKAAVAYRQRHTPVTRKGLRRVSVEQINGPFAKLELVRGPSERRNEGENGKSSSGESEELAASSR